MMVCCRRLVVLTIGTVLAFMGPASAAPPSYSVTDFIAVQNGGTITMAPGGSRLFTNFFRPNGAFFDPSIRVIDIATGTLVSETYFPFGGNVLDIEVSPDESRVYLPVAAIQGSNTPVPAPSRIEVLDTETNSPLTPIPNVGNFGPQALALTPDGSRIYVNPGLPGSGVVTVVDTATNSTIAIPVGTDQLIGITVTPDGTRVYAADRGNPSAIAIDTSTNTVIATVPRTSGGTRARTDIAITPDGTRGYITQSGSTLVSVIDVDPNSPTYHQALGSIPTTAPTSLRAITITPDGRAAIVLGSNEDLIVIDVDPNSPTFHTQVGVIPLAPGSVPQRIINDGLQGGAIYVTTVDGIFVIEADPLLLRAVQRS